MNVEDKARQILCDQLGVSHDEVKTGADFIEDLGVDSLDIVELTMCFEENFDIDIDDEDVEKLRTFGQAVDYIKKRLDKSVNL